MNLPQKLIEKLELRKQTNALRSLSVSHAVIDFSSNDYLGFAHSTEIFDETHQYLVERNFKTNGATGSRLLSGNHVLYPEAEKMIAQFHQVPSALLFNSGYDANVGFFSSVPQRTDVVLYDELSHASIRDGIQMTAARSYKFRHNDFEDLERLILKYQKEDTVLYVVTESVFSMDGDSPNFEELTALTTKYNVLLVVDEAHALGVFGEQGEGFIQYLGLQDKVFARIVTFGKALGCHGAVVLGSEDLKTYLINFARSFIYTTGLSPHSVATIIVAYQKLISGTTAIQQLKHNIIHFNQEKHLLGLKPMFVFSKSAIQCAILPGNEKVKTVAANLQSKGFDVKAILSPTVPEGQERLRICLHSYNTFEEISALMHCIYGLL